MRYRRVDATAFGPLHGEELEFGPGLNVVVGPNEARKSSWHAAMYAGLCGRRRGKGRASGPEADFERRHRPWEGSDWIVRAEIELDDGRTVELRHDLDNRRTEVIDLEFGRPVTDDIIFEGAPDGARWLGLDRRTFLATACIRQAEILAVAEESDGLRNLLQRAASTLGGDMTASAAIEALDQFRRDEVGKDQTNSIRPLRKAKEALQEAVRRQSDTAEAHHHYQQLLARADRATAELEIAEHDLRAAERAAEHRDWQRELEELDVLVSLAEQVATNAGQEAESTDLEALRDALANWSVTLEPRPLVGPSADDLRAEIAAIAAPIDFDSTVDPQIAALSSELGRARVVVEGLGAEPPRPTSDADLDVAVTVARRASSPAPAGPLHLVTEYERLSSLSAAHERQIGYSRIAVRLAAAGGVAAILLALTGGLPVALVVAVGSLLVGAASVVFARSTTDDTAERLTELEHKFGEHERRVVDHADDRRSARAWLVERGLPPDPAHVAALAAEHGAMASQHARWAARRAELVRDLDTVTAQLFDALGSKGIVDPDVDQAMSSYLTWVDRAAAVARQRLVIDQLRERLSTRERAERDHDEQLARRVAAGEHLVARVATFGVGMLDVDEAADTAESLIADQEARRVEAGRVERLRTEFGTRLGDRDFDDVLARRDTLVARIDAATSSSRHPGDPDDVTGATQRRNDLMLQVTEARTRLDGIDESSVDTAAAVAEVEGARREVERIERLGHTLDLTAEYLEEAETEAYRTVAPRIAAEVNAHLSDVTNGRYTEALVDPEQLTVRVRDAAGSFRDADRLSHGTAEQVHLLLRVAMARTLTNRSETCPLLIDDATVHADEARTDAVLDLLLELADERQVVLFSQEAHVREWARRRLDGPQHRVIDLDAA